MRTGLNRSRRTRRTQVAVLSAVLMVSGMLVFGAQPSSATITKTIDVTCQGADPDSAKAMGAIPGGLPPIPVTATVEAPAFVEPGQTDVPISISWSLTVSAALTDLLITAGVTSADILNAKVDTEVSGPTSTTLIEGRPPGQSITISKGAGLTSSFGPFSGQLDDIGNSGVIKLRNQSVDFSMLVSVFPNPINMTCPIGATIATIPVKVAGSPDITQPITEDGVNGQSITVDVLGKYVKNGVDKSGVVRQVDPSTLKVIEGPGSVQGGKLVIPSPAAGAASDTTFEVCAGTVEVAPATEGTDEVQRIRLFHEPGNSFKRSFAATFNLGGEPGAPVWMVGQNTVLALGGPQPWGSKVMPYALAGASGASPYEWPTDAEMAAALQSIPEVGPGNVEVTVGDIQVQPGSNGQKAYQYRDYEVHFTGAKGKQDVPDLKTTHLASFLPQELLANLLAQVQKLGEPKPGPTTTTTTIPGGMTAKEYLDQIWADAGKAWAQLDLQTYFQKVQLWLTVFGDNIMSLIDINAALSFITGLFPRAPEINWLTQGEDPKDAEMQELCSQGVVTVTTPDVGGVTTTSVPGDGTGSTGSNDAEGISFAG